MPTEQTNQRCQASRLTVPDKGGGSDQPQAAGVTQAAGVWDELPHRMLRARRPDDRKAQLQCQDLPDTSEASRPSAAKPQHLASLDCLSLEMRELDLRQVAEDLHDNLGQSLATLRRKIGARLSPAEHGQLASISECVADALSEVRRITVLDRVLGEFDVARSAPSAEGLVRRCSSPDAVGVTLSTVVHRD
jgi:hypothetical protein